VVAWFKNEFCLKYHSPRYEIFSVPNEATYKNNQFKSTGVRNGVSDLIILLTNKVLFIEMKDVNNTQSEQQKDFEKVVLNLGFEYYVVRSLEQFKKLICEKLK